MPEVKPWRRGPRKRSEPAFHLNCQLEPDLARALDDYAGQHRITRSAAVRTLLESALRLNNKET